MKLILKTIALLCSLGTVLPAYSKRIIPTYMPEKTALTLSEIKYLLSFAPDATTNVYLGKVECSQDLSLFPNAQGKTYKYFVLYSVGEGFFEAYSGCYMNLAKEPSRYGSIIEMHLVDRVHFIREDHQSTFILPYNATGNCTGTHNDNPVIAVHFKETEAQPA